MSAALPTILVAGIGNIFLGDDAFGCEVAQRLMRRAQPSHVRVVDFGIRGLDLVYALSDCGGAAILVDAVPREGQTAGTVFVLEPDVQSLRCESPVLMDAHSMDPMKVLSAVAAMGSFPQRVLIVGCQPAMVPGEEDDGTDIPMTLSDAVAAAIEPAVEMVESLIGRLTSEFMSNSKELSSCKQ